MYSGSEGYYGSESDTVIWLRCFLVAQRGVAVQQVLLRYRE